MGKTVVLGASPNSRRYSYVAVKRLLDAGEEVVPVGIKKGVVHGLEILNNKPEIDDVDTITLYIGSANQPPWYDYILSLKPKRIILNPGTENCELEQLARDQGVETMNACTLVMVSVGSY